MSRSVPDKAVLYTSTVGKAIPEGYDRAEALAQWPRWSLGIRVANLLFASGTGGQGADGRITHVDDPRRQARLAMQRLLILVEAGGARAEDLISIRVYLDNPAYGDEVLTGVGEFLAEHLNGGYPAFSLVVANTSDPSVFAEIEAFAATEHESIRCPDVPVPFTGSLMTSPRGWKDFAHAVRVGNLWFLSAVLPIDATGQVVGLDAAAQSVQTLANLGAVLRGIGRDPFDLVRLTIWVADGDVLGAVQEAVRGYLTEAFGPLGGPATSVLIAPLLQPGALVQLEAIAATGGRRVVDVDLVAHPGRVCPVAAVAVQLSDEVDSFVRRFTWPEPVPGETGSIAPSRRPLGEIVFLSAQSGTNRMGVLASDDMTEQTRQALQNMEMIVEAAGGLFEDIVQFDVYYLDRELYADYNTARIAFLEEHNPGSAWFAGSGPRATSALPGALIEIESIAVIQ